MKIVISIVITAIVSSWITAQIKETERTSKEATYHSEVVLPLRKQIELLEENRELLRRQTELLKEQIKLIKDVNLNQPEQVNPITRP